MAAQDKWNEWSLKVLQEIAALSSEISTLSSKQENFHRDIEEVKKQLTREFEEKEKSIAEKIDSISELLNGNGSPEKGIIVRLDRIEQNEQRRTWLLRTTIVASIGAILSTLANWFKPQ